MNSKEVSKRYLNSSNSTTAISSSVQKEQSKKFINVYKRQKYKPTRCVIIPSCSKIDRKCTSVEPLIPNLEEIGSSVSKAKIKQYNELSKLIKVSPVSSKVLKKQLSQPNLKTNKEKNKYAFVKFLKSTSKLKQVETQSLNSRSKSPIVHEMEKMIGKIKQNGFNKCEEQIKQKWKIKEDLEKNVEALKQSKRQNHCLKKYTGENNVKVEDETNNIARRIENSEKSLFFVKKQIPGLQNEIQTQKISIENFKNNTAQLNKDILSEIEYQDQCKQHIRLYKDMISEINKDQKLLKFGNSSILKFITSTKLKIKDKEKSINQLMKDVRNIISKENL